MIRGSGDKQTLKVHERFVAGSMAGATAQTAIYPLEVRQRTRPPVHIHRYFQLTSPFPLTGAENPPDLEENRPVLWDHRLCQADPREGGNQGLLQRLYTQPSGHYSIRWHRPGCL